MRKIWSNIKASGKAGIIEFIIDTIFIIGSIGLLILDCKDIINLSVEQTLQVSIILLDLLITASMIEKYGVLSDINKTIQEPENSKVILTNRTAYEANHSYNKDISKTTEIDLLAIANTFFARQWNN